MEFEFDFMKPDPSDRLRCEPFENVDLNLMSEVLILPDGRVLVHNLTPAFSRLLAALEVALPAGGHTAAEIAVPVNRREQPAS